MSNWVHHYLAEIVTELFEGHKIMKQSGLAITMAAMGAVVMIVAAPSANAATAPDKGAYFAADKAPVSAMADRTGEYQIAGRRSRKRLGTALGIAAGVAATAIIINEAAKAEKRRKRKKANQRARARQSRSRNCHRDMRKHFHRALGGNVLHRHNSKCVAYEVYPDDGEGDVAVAPPAQASRCDRGYEYIDGQCYRNEELDAQPASDRRVSNEDDAAYAQCARDYRSFDPDDGTFQPYGDRPRKVCPYLQ